MKTANLKFPVALLLMLCVSGCMNVNYVGQRFEPTTNVRVFTGEANDEYEIIGKATLTAPGSYTSYEIRQRLVAEAEKNGADAVNIVDSRLEQDGSFTVLAADSPGFQPQGRIGANSQEAVDSFGVVEASPPKEVKTYKNVVRAYFLRLKSKRSPELLMKDEQQQLLVEEKNISEK